MSGQPFRAWRLSAAVWTVSLFLPAGNLLVWLIPQAVPEPALGGVAFLALPRQLADPAALLAGDWQALALGSPLEGPREHPPEAPAIPQDPDPPACRVRLHGHLAVEDGIEYYFLDTGSNRWFRLRRGEADPDAGVRLLGMEAPPGLWLLDLRENRTWAVRPGAGGRGLFPGSLPEGEGCP